MSENIRNINLAQSNVSVYKTKNISYNLSITLFFIMTEHSPTTRSLRYHFYGQVSIFSGNVFLVIKQL